MKHILSYFTVVCAVLTVPALFLPLYSSHTPPVGETFVMNIRGYELCAFNPWGALTILAPLLLIAVLFAAVPDEVKTVLLICLSGLYTVGTMITYRAVYDYLLVNGNGRIDLLPTRFVEPALFLFAAICMYIQFNCLSRRHRS